MTDMEQAEVNQNKAIRGYIIRCLVKGFNNTSLTRQISNAMMAAGLIISPDISKHLNYLQGAGYIEFTSEKVTAYTAYVLTQAGIKEYRLNGTEYGKKDTFIVNKQNGIKAIAQVGSTWGIDNDFFFQNEIFYWGCKPEQETIYVLEESENILSLKKYGELYEIETLGVPWIHHSQEVEVSHSKYSGTVKVEKTIIKSDARGYTRMYIYFKGGG